MMGKKRQHDWQIALNVPISRLLAVGVTTVGGMVALT
jgi:hypothetical protein